MWEQENKGLSESYVQLNLRIGERKHKSLQKYRMGSSFKRLSKIKPWHRVQSPNPEERLKSLNFNLKKLKSAA